ncbi:hypothetical protein M3202_21310, partial [Alkalihalobacillus oceani]
MKGKKTGLVPIKKPIYQSKGFKYSTAMLGTTLLVPAAVASLPEDVEQVPFNVLANQAKSMLGASEVSAESIIHIYTVNDLNNIRNDASGNYRLMNDIDLSSVENWEPLPRFDGVLEGNGHTIFNLTIEKNESDVGLFR